MSQRWPGGHITNCQDPLGRPTVWIYRNETMGIGGNAYYIKAEIIGVGFATNADHDPVGGHRFGLPVCFYGEPRRIEAGGFGSQHGAHAQLGQPSPYHPAEPRVQLWEYGGLGFHDGYRRAELRPSGAKLNANVAPADNSQIGRNVTKIEEGAGGVNYPFTIERQLRQLDRPGPSGNNGLFELNMLNRIARADHSPVGPCETGCAADDFDTGGLEQGLNSGGEFTNY